MLEELFKLGPYKVCFLNIVIIAISFFGAFVLKKIIHRGLKRYLSSANIRLEGKRKNYLRLFSQSAYGIAIYISVMSFNINNHDASFKEFLDYQFIHTSKLKMSFENVIVIFLIIFPRFQFRAKDAKCIVCSTHQLLLLLLVSWTQI